MFDSILAQYNHFGSVYVEFEVDAQGRLQNTNLRVSSSDSILKVHVMRALRKGLKETFKEEKWNPSGQTSILQAKFEFLQGSADVNFQKQKAFGKPILVFKRATTEKPLPTTMGEHLLNGGISYDAFAMAERWEKFNKKKKLRELSFDPFTTYKADPDYNL
ncbi:hypothetical protein [Bdellovibrio sp. ArHS]|uniref:energy transducer TonB n=1 Tax=Bdellovibrio sp. ArHS TaxID=1569284 RepID=UPI0025C436B9|nr:hypothetical protein [Bdellovibrio sp. ArHS]